MPSLGKLKNHFHKNSTANQADFWHGDPLGPMIGYDERDSCQILSITGKLIL